MAKLRRIGQRLTSRILLPKKVQVHLTHEFHGTIYGGWTITPEELSHQSIIYSLGIGKDISFDISLIESYGVQVFAFDPTPQSIQWLKEQSLPTQFQSFEYGIADYDGTAKFYAPENVNYVSHTLVSNMKQGENYQEVSVWRLKTIMEMLGHSEIDILKMDIEGAEYNVIDDMLTSNIRPKQLLVEFHHRLLPMGMWRTYRALQKLKAFDYDIFSISTTGNEYSFIRRRQI